MVKAGRGWTLPWTYVVSTVRAPRPMGCRERRAQLQVEVQHKHQDTTTTSTSTHLIHQASSRAVDFWRAVSASCQIPTLGGLSSSLV